MSNCVFVWDAEGLPPEGDCTVVLWRGFAASASSSIISIPKLVEDNADVLKARYLAWVYDLGEKCIDGKRVVDHLEIRPEFSYWWMTLIAEKCNYAYSPHITDSIRLMAFEVWATKRTLGRVVLASSNRPLVECMRLLCIKLDVPFEWQCIEEQLPFTPLIRRIYQVLPLFVQALLRLVHYFVDRWALRGVGLNEWRKTQGQMTFFSYLVNLEPNAAANGHYESRYWANLPNKLQGEGCKVNWLHLYIKNELLPTAKSAARMINEFNLTGNSSNVHVTLDSFLSVWVGIKSLCDWCKLIWVGRRLDLSMSTVTSNGLVLWPLFAKEWHESMVGSRSIINILYLNLFEAATKILPQQKVGVYLYEQQPWELALIHAWKVSRHESLIGAQHATMLYWDLRYFHDPRTYKQTSRNGLPMPNRLAVNGPVALNTSIKSGYPEKNLVEVEALRYLHLGEDNVKKHSVRTVKKTIMRLLVLCDYLAINTRWQMDVLAQAIPLLSEDIIITVKPHPISPIKSQDYPDINMTITDEPIAGLLGECDVAYSSTVTSAAVDAYCAGKPVVTVLDPKSLNLSPLKGSKGVSFVSSPEALAAVLNRMGQMKEVAGQGKDYFYLDTNLSRWKQLLKQSGILN